MGDLTYIRFGVFYVFCGRSGFLGFVGFSERG